MPIVGSLVECVVVQLLVKSSVIGADTEVSNLVYIDIKLGNYGLLVHVEKGSLLSFFRPFLIFFLLLRLDHFKLQKVVPF